MRVPMRDTYQVLPEGEYIFLITDVKEDEDFGKIEITLETKEGKKHRERFSLKTADDEWNEGALNAFSYFCKTATQDWESEEIDPQSLVGCYIKAEVEHTVVQSNKDAGKTVTFANLGDKWPADGFEGQGGIMSALDD